MENFEHESLVGKTREEALAVAEANGFTTRITSIDGDELIGDCALRMSRINLEIEKGIVTGTYLG